MGLKICLGIFFVLFLLLLIPIRYRFILEIKHLAVTVEFIFGLYKKTMELPGKKRERTADADEKMEELLFADVQSGYCKVVYQQTPELYVLHFLLSFHNLPVTGYRRLYLVYES